MPSRWSRAAISTALRPLCLPGICWEVSTSTASSQIIASGLLRLAGKRETLTADCRRCDYRFACHGGCPLHRFARLISGHPAHNYLCAGEHKHFQVRRI